jgi:hypothetical protein
MEFLKKVLKTAGQSFGIAFSGNKKGTINPYFQRKY